LVTKKEVGTCAPCPARWGVKSKGERGSIMKTKSGTRGQGALDTSEGTSLMTDARTEPAALEKVVEDKGAGGETGRSSKRDLEEDLMEEGMKEILLKKE